MATLNIPILKNIQQPIMYRYNKISLFIFIACFFPLGKAAAEYNNSVDENTWAGVIASHDSINVNANNPGQLHGVFLSSNAVQYDDAIGTNYLSNKELNIEVTNTSTSAGSETYGLRADRVTLFNPPNTVSPKVKQSAVLNFDKTHIRVEASNGLAAGLKINTELNYQPQSGFISKKHSSSQTVNLADGSSIHAKAEGNSGNAYAVSLSNKTTIQTAPSGSIDSITLKGKLSNHSELNMGSNIELIANANQKAYALSSENSFQLGNYEILSNDTMRYTTDITLGNGYLLDARSTDDDAYGLHSTNSMLIDNHLSSIDIDDEGFSIMTTTNLGNAGRILARSETKNAYGVDLKNSSLLDSSGIDVVLPPDNDFDEDPVNSFQNLLEVGEDSEIEVWAKQAAYGVKLSESLHSKEVYQLENINSKTAVNLKDRVKVRATAIDGNSYAIHAENLGKNNSEGLNGIDSTVELKLGNQVELLSRTAKGDAYGIMAKNRYQQGDEAGSESLNVSVNIAAGNNLTITSMADEGKSFGIFAENIYTQDDESYAENTNALMTMSFGNNLHIASWAKDDRAYGIWLRQASTLGESNSAMPSIKSSANIKLQLGDNSIISSQSNSGNAYGIYSLQQGELISGTNPNKADLGIDITLGNNTNIHSVSTDGDAYGIYVDDTSNSIASQFRNSVKLNGKTTIYAQGQEAYALYASGKNASISSETAGEYDITGDILAKNGANIALEMQGNSIIRGNTSVSNGGSISLNLNGAQSVWQMLGDSEVTSLTLNNNSMVQFNSPSLHSRAIEYSTLTIGELIGNGLFHMRADFDRAQSGLNTSTIGKDFLQITDVANNSQSLIVINNAAHQNANVNDIALVNVTNGTTDKNAFQLLNPVEVGAYKYRLECQEEGGLCKYWLLKRYGGPSSSAKAAINTINIGYLITYSETQTALSRLDELRTSHKYDGLWINNYNGGFRSFGTGEFLEGFTMKYHGFQLGTDKKYETANAKSYFGIMTGLTESSPRYEYGSGSLNSWHAGIYNTTIYNNGLYFDSLLRYTQMKHKYNVSDTQNNTVSGSTTTKGISATLAVGRRTYLSRASSGISTYLEPQAQVSLSYNGSNDFTASNGLQVSLESYTSVLSRLSAQVGFEKLNSPTPFNGYLRFSYLNEMSAKNEFLLSNSYYLQKFTGDWFAMGIGLNTQFFNQHSVFMDMERADGRRFDQYQMNIGYRYSF